MKVLNKQIYFTASFKNKALVSLILGSFLTFIIIGLEPFDTNEYESANRFVLLSGFGGLLAIVCFLQSSFENIWYRKVNKIWCVSHEIISTITFFTLSGTVIYLYNHFIINGQDYSMASHWWYYSHIVVALIPVIGPILIFLRQKFGECLIPVVPNTIFIAGENKNEELTLQKHDVLYIQAIENYIEIYYLNAHQQILSKTFRQTLSNAHKQVAFLEKCHRSYLVNLNHIKQIHGNSQSAKIAFEHTDTKIPLSKTCYKHIKNSLA